MLPDPATPGSLPSIPQKIPEEKIVDVAEVDRRCCLEESGHWHENVDLTHPVPVSGNLVQKNLEVLRFEPRVAGFEVSILVNKVDPVQVGP